MQVALDKELQSNLAPKIQNNQVVYDVNICTPAEKIWSSLSYGESINLFFRKSSFRDTGRIYALEDRQSNSCKLWDREGNLINQPR